ncbi:MAG: hypothetical protein V8S31_00620 [Lachnospiraceae bacterium]
MLEGGIDEIVVALASIQMRKHLNKLSTILLADGASTLLCHVVEEIESVVWKTEYAGAIDRSHARDDEVEQAIMLVRRENLGMVRRRQVTAVLFKRL